MMGEQLHPLPTSDILCLEEETIRQHSPGMQERDRTGIHLRECRRPGTENCVEGRDNHGELWIPRSTGSLRPLWNLLKKDSDIARTKLLPSGRSKGTFHNTRREEARG